MPLYDFQCPRCDGVTEVLMRHLDVNPKCVDCGRRMKRLPSAPAGLRVIGYSAKNGYSMPSESQPSNLKGIRTTVKEG